MRATSVRAGEAMAASCGGSHHRSTLPARTPTKVSAMAMANAIAEAMNAAAICSLRAAATMAGDLRFRPCVVFRRSKLGSSFGPLKDSAESVVFGWPSLNRGFEEET